MLRFLKSLVTTSTQERNLELGESGNSTTTNSGNNSPEKNSKNSTDNPQTDNKTKDWSREVRFLGEYGSLAATAAAGILGIIVPNSSTAGLYVSASTTLSLGNASQGIKLFAANYLLKQAHALLFTGLVEINDCIKMMEDKKENDSPVLKQLKTLSKKVANVLAAAEKIEAQNLIKLTLDTLHLLIFLARMVMYTQEPQNTGQTDDAQQNFTQASQYFDLALSISSMLLLIVGYYCEKKTNNVMSHAETHIARQDQSINLVPGLDDSNVKPVATNNDDIQIDDEQAVIRTRSRITENLSREQIAAITQQMAQQQVQLASNSQDEDVLKERADIMNLRPTSSAPRTTMINGNIYVSAKPPTLAPPLPPTQQHQQQQLNFNSI